MDVMFIVRDNCAVSMVVTIVQSVWMLGYCVSLGCVCMDVMFIVRDNCAVSMVVTIVQSVWMLGYCVSLGCVCMDVILQSVWSLGIVCHWVVYVYGCDVGIVCGNCAVYGGWVLCVSLGCGVASLVSCSE